MLSTIWGAVEVGCSNVNRSVKALRLFQSCRDKGGGLDHAPPKIVFAGFFDFDGHDLANAQVFKAFVDE